MDSRSPLTDRPWYRYGLLTLAVGGVAACGYFFATYRGWLRGDSGPLSSLLLLCANTAFLWGLVFWRRSGALALGLQSVGALLLVWSIAALSRGS